VGVIVAVRDADGDVVAVAAGVNVADADRVAVTVGVSVAVTVREGDGVREGPGHAATNEPFHAGPLLPEGVICWQWRLEEAAVEPHRQLQVIS
jgi:hypothetical protein